LTVFDAAVFGNHVFGNHVFGNMVVDAVSASGSARVSR
jgi:hypothetical protein